MLAVGLILILTIAFFAIYRMPGDPARMILGPRATAETVAEFRKTAGLDDPVLVQFGRFSRKMVTLDFGVSLTARRPVADLLGERVDQTLLLIAYSLVVLIVFGVCVPLVLRITAFDRVDKLLRVLWSGAAAAPPYVLAILTLTILAGSIDFLPAVFNPERARCWFAAAFVLAAYPTALVSRLFNDALDVAMQSEYVSRARAHGFGNATLLLREASLNAISAPVSAIANGLAYFATGTFFVEVAFGIGGIGTLTYDAIRNKDLTVLAAICLLFAMMISIVSAVLDVAQQVIDPKLRRRHA